MTPASHTSTIDLSLLVDRVRGEYLEMPGLTLTIVQAQRLWGLDETRCSSVLASLVDAGFLQRTKRGFSRR